MTRPRLMETRGRVTIPHNPGESEYGIVQEIPELTGNPLYDDFQEVTVLREGCTESEKVLFCYISTKEDIAKLQAYIREHPEALEEE